MHGLSRTLLTNAMGETPRASLKALKMLRALPPVTVASVSMLSGSFQFASMYSSTMPNLPRSRRRLGAVEQVGEIVPVGGEERDHHQLLIFGQDLIGDFGVLEIELGGQEDQQATASGAIPARSRYGELEIARDRGSDHGAQLGLQGGRVDSQPQFAMARAAVDPGLGAGGNQAAVVAVGREVPGAERGARASGEREHLPHLVDAGDSDADGAVIVGRIRDRYA